MFETPLQFSSRFNPPLSRSEEFLPTDETSREFQITRIRLLQEIVAFARDRNIEIELTDPFSESAFSEALANFSDEQLFELHSDLNSSYFFEDRVEGIGSVTLDHHTSYEDMPFVTKPVRNKQVIPEGLHVAWLHFLPFGDYIPSEYENPQFELEIIALGINDFVEMLKEISYRKAQGMEVPAYLLGYTNPAMADIAIKRLGFDEFQFDSIKDRLQRIREIFVPSERMARKRYPTKQIVSSTSDLLADLPKLEAQRDNLIKLMEKRKKISLREARVKAIEYIAYSARRWEIDDLTESGQSVPSILEDSGVNSFRRRPKTEPVNPEFVEKRLDDLIPLENLKIPESFGTFPVESLIHGNTLLLQLLSATRVDGFEHNDFTRTARVTKPLSDKLEHEFDGEITLELQGLINLGKAMLLYYDAGSVDRNVYMTRDPNRISPEKDMQIFNPTSGVYPPNQIYRLRNSNVPIDGFIQHQAEVIARYVDNSDLGLKTERRKWGETMCLLLTLLSSDLRISQRWKELRGRLINSLRQAQVIQGDALNMTRINEIAHRTRWTQRDIEYVTGLIALLVDPDRIEIPRFELYKKEVSAAA